MGASSNAPLVAGDRLHDYELLCRVGEGGMATVWIARLLRKRGFEKVVAIKTILTEHAEDENFREMFFDEARIASRIEHPNVAHVHDLGEERGVLFLVMEYIDGHALTVLRKKLKKTGTPFPIPVAVRIMADACAGLTGAHELRNLDGSSLAVVHRDVSPQNVLISGVGISKLIDFGVAKAVNRLASRTSAGYVKGKVHYMAPEQALAKTVDPRADIWGVGAVLYTLISGRYPFDAENHLALLARLQREEPPAPLPADTPLPIAAIIDRALSFDPKQRFQTADEMRLALEESGHAGTHREVGQCLAEHLSLETEQRRKAINAARVAADARGDDVAPAPRPPDEHAPTLKKPRPATPQVTLPLGQAPPEIQALIPDATTKLPKHPVLRPSSNPLIVIEPPRRVSVPTPIEGPDLQSRSGYGTNAGVASGGSYGFAPPPPAPPKTPAPTPWMIIAAGALGLASLVIGLVMSARSRTMAEVPDAEPPRIAVASPPLPLAEPDPAPRPIARPDASTEQARAALLRGDTATVKRLLGEKVRSGHATPEEANMLKHACKASGDKACIEDVKRLYPSL